MMQKEPDNPTVPTVSDSVKLLDSQPFEHQAQNQ